MDSDVKKYGTTQAEREAEEVIRCREIVKEITSFGVSQFQVLKLIELLSLELENRDHLQQISGLVKRLGSGDSKKTTLLLK